MGGHQHNQHAGKRIALVALGPTAAGYVEYAQRIGGRFALYDEVWTCNTFTGILEADLIFHMDDFRVQEIREEGGNARVGNMLASMRKTKTPVCTSRAYPEYPTSFEFPLSEVLNYYGPPGYFNNTMAYAIAYAGFAKVKSLHCYGLDYFWGDQPKKIETGKACCEFWLGRIIERSKVAVSVVQMSTLMNGGKNQFYGYDTRDVRLSLSPEGSLIVGFSEKKPPTADEIEELYDHAPERLKYSGVANGTSNEEQELADAANPQDAG